MRNSLSLSSALLVVFVWAVVALGVAGSPAQARADERAAGAWRVFQVTGDVRVRSAGAAAAAWRSVAEGDGIAAPAAIETGERGQITLTRAGDVVHVLPRSTLALPADDPGGLVTEVVQTVGEAIFGVDKRPERSFTVRTPHLVAVVKGTAFGVAVSETGASVSVSEGRVGVASVGSGKGADIGPGQRATVSSDAAGGVSVSTAPGAAARPGPAPQAEDAAAPKGKGAKAKAVRKAGGPSDGKRQEAGGADDGAPGKSDKSAGSGSGSGSASPGASSASGGKAKKGKGGK